MSTTQAGTLPGKHGPDTLIRNIRVFDGERVVEADAVVLHDGVIAGVGNGISARRARVVDGRAAPCSRGLIDSHVHAELINLEQALVFGGRRRWTCSIHQRSSSMRGTR